MRKFIGVRLKRIALLLVVIACGMLLIKLGVEPIPNMLIPMLATTLTTLLIHHYGILPSRTLRFLFNGK